MRTPPLRKDDTWDTWFIGLLDKAFPTAEVYVGIAYLPRNLCYAIRMEINGVVTQVWSSDNVGGLTLYNRYAVTQIIEAFRREHEKTIPPPF